MRKCTWLLVAVFLICSPLSVMAGNISKKDLVGDWSGSLGDYRSTFAFAGSGEYTSIVFVMGMEMVSSGHWSLQGNSLKLAQKQAIMNGRRENDRKSFTRRVLRLDRGHLQLVHKDANGNPIRSSYRRK